MKFLQVPIRCPLCQLVSLVEITTLSLWDVFEQDTVPRLREVSVVAPHLGSRLRPALLDIIPRTTLAH
jgi:hypothetical protein